MTSSYFDTFLETYGVYLVKYFMKQFNNINNENTNYVNDNEKINGN